MMIGVMMITRSMFVLMTSSRDSVYDVPEGQGSQLVSATTGLPNRQLWKLVGVAWDRALRHGA
jgi:hypothetical protein